MMLPNKNILLYNELFYNQLFHYYAKQAQYVCSWYVNSLVNQPSLTNWIE